MRRVMVVLRGFVFWTMLGLFFAAQDFILGYRGVTAALARKWAMPRWYIWGLLAPLIAATDRRIGQVTGTWRDGYAKGRSKVEPRADGVWTATRTS